MKMLKRIFKPATALFALSALLFLASLSSPVQGITGTSPKNNARAALKFPKISITITIGRASRKCGGFGICKISLGFATASIEKRRVKAELTRTDDGKLEITLLEKAPEEGQTLVIDQDIPLSRSIAQKLGVRRATIPRGEYSFSENKSRLDARLTK